MRHLGAFIFLAGLAAGCDGTSTVDDCQTLCDTYDAVGCDNEQSIEECYSLCDEPIPVCQVEYEAMVGCLADKSTAADYTCNEETGEAEMMESTVCEEETLLLVVCALSESE